MALGFNRCFRDVPAGRAFFPKGQAPGALVDAGIERRVRRLLWVSTGVRFVISPALLIVYLYAHGSNAQLALWTSILLGFVFARWAEVWAVIGCARVDADGAVFPAQSMEARPMPLAVVVGPALFAGFWVVAGIRLSYMSGHGMDRSAWELLVGYVFMCLIGAFVWRMWRREA